MTELSMTEKVAMRYHNNFITDIKYLHWDFLAPIYCNNPFKQQTHPNALPAEFQTQIPCQP